MGRVARTYNLTDSEYSSLWTPVHYILVCDSLIMPSYQSILMVSAMAALVVARFGPNETSLEQLSRYHPRDVLIKRSRDCGTFTMYCGGLPKAGGGDRSAAAPMACA